MKIIDTLNRRYATKKFDINKKVSIQDLDEIIESFRLTPSSFWLEPWKLIIIKNQDIKKDLYNHSFNQEQIITCSHLLVLCRIEDLWESHIEKIINNMSEISWSTMEQLKWYNDMTKWFISKLDKTSKNSWSNNQVYIALWLLHAILAYKKIDSCAIGWFNSEKYDEILWLKEKWLSSVVILPIWYRDLNDKYINKKKIRLSKMDVVQII